jgi:hypothetical protein
VLSLLTPPLCPPCPSFVTTRCTTLPRAQQVIFISHMICCMWWGLSQTISTETWADKAHLVYDTLGDAPFQVRPIQALSRLY